MTISIWRYSHLSLALVSGLFLVLASLTGIILAFEPMQSAIKPYQPLNLSEISLAETIGALQNEYDEVLTLKVDANDFVVADVVTKNGESETLYIHPKTGERLGKPQPQHPIFQFTTNLHRSLFLKGIGRFFVGLVSFLLCLIAITGLLLIIKRQGGLDKLFSRVQKDYFELRYHVVLGRWFLVPIIIVAATGVYLSAEKFSLLPSTKVNHEMVAPSTEVDTSVQPSDLELFQGIMLNEVRSVTFPFSEFPEDYFELALRKKELFVHQYTGEILSEQHYPFTFLASRLSLILHTGQGSILWSIVLLLASMVILFFIYSGFVMWRRRQKSTKAVAVRKDKNECTHIILVGSETGNTFGFAKALEKGLTEIGKSVFVSQMNDYSAYAKAEHIIVLTATYGEGEAPTNARNFHNLVKNISIEQPLSYSVVGFGSLLYPGYCQFAVEVDQVLNAHPNFKKALPIYKINNQSFEAFKDWSKKWSETSGTTITLKSEKKKVKSLKKHNFKVIQKTELNNDGTFLIRLRPENKIKFRSGDLWEYQPEDGISRWYSIARIGDEAVLSIKKHEFGLVSTFLSGIPKNKILPGGIKRNYDFHYPKHAPALVCIANGTGMAPFLGIINENRNNIPIDMFWGVRRRESLHIYQEYLEKGQALNKQTKLHLAFSQEHGSRQYVQDLIRNNGIEITKKLNQGSVFMICGSLAMQNEVLDVLSELSEIILKKPLSEFEQQGQLKMDCY